MSQGLYEGADHVRDAGGEWAESARGAVRENPLTTLVAALATGLIAARLAR